MKPITSLLIANRGEIAIRIARAAIDLGIRTISIYPDDDAASLHTCVADEARRLEGQGPAAYLDQAQIIALAKAAGADAIHPGYGFLSENAAFAQRCESEGIVFVGPKPGTLDCFGDKAKARSLARNLGVPVFEGTDAPLSLEDAKAFFLGLGPDAAIAIKAVAGGGGRGMRIVSRFEQLEREYERCMSEATRAFGNGDLYAERAMRHARHVEVQVIGDGTGTVVHIGERECSLQRRHQKLIEIAPAPGLSPQLRDSLCAAAVKMAASERYLGLGTFEFLVDARNFGSGGDFAFIEANPRLQVEHTVTEAVFGLDLVQLQLQVLGGTTLSELGLAPQQARAPEGFAIQLRVNMEKIDAKGNVRPASGKVIAFDPPSGPGVRTDTFFYGGYSSSLHYDSLVAKVIAHSRSGRFPDAVRRASRAAEEFRIEGISTNLAFLQGLLQQDDFVNGNIDTLFVERNSERIASAAALHKRRYFDAITDIPD